MASQTTPALFTYLQAPRFRLRNPDADLSFDEFDQLRITAEDYRFVTREVTTNLSAVSAEIRCRSTVLRRLLSEGDLFSIGRYLKPTQGLRVRARMLDFSPLHPGMILTCGNYPWAGDRLEGIGIELGVRGIAPTSGPAWSYRENEDVALSEYLGGLAIAVMGTPISRREVIKFVADKKAAHVSTKRKLPYEMAMDRAWAGLTITVRESAGRHVPLNAGYLELLSVIRALAESETIQAYIDRLEKWITSAEPFLPSDVTPVGLSIPMDPREC